MVSRGKIWYTETRAGRAWYKKKYGRYPGERRGYNVVSRKRDLPHKKRSSGTEFEEKVERFLKKSIPTDCNVVRGSSLKYADFKDPDYYITRDKERIGVECKCTDISKKGSVAAYWTQFARGYTLLNDMNSRSRIIKRILVFNTKNKDYLDYCKVCKRANIEFICFDKDKEKLREIIRQTCQ